MSQDSYYDNRESNSDNTDSETSRINNDLDTEICYDDYIDFAYVKENFSNGNLDECTYSQTMEPRIILEHMNENRQIYKQVLKTSDMGDCYFIAILLLLKLTEPIIFLRCLSWEQVLDEVNKILWIYHDKTTMSNQMLEEIRDFKCCCGHIIISKYPHEYKTYILVFGNFCVTKLGTHEMKRAHLKFNRIDCNQCGKLNCVRHIDPNTNKRFVTCKLCSTKTNCSMCNKFAKCYDNKNNTASPNCNPCQKKVEIQRLKQLKIDDELKRARIALDIRRERERNNKLLEERNHEYRRKLEHERQRIAKDAELEKELIALDIRRERERIAKDAELERQRIDNETRRERERIAKDAELERQRIKKDNHRKFEQIQDNAIQWERKRKCEEDFVKLKNHSIFEYLKKIKT